MTTWVGAPEGWAARRIDPMLVTGRGAYVGNINVPGHLRASIVRSHVAHGKLMNVITDAARAMPGVRAVLTAEDLDEVPTIPGRPGLLPAHLKGLQQPVIAVDRVRYVGEPVAIVIADDAYVAEDAAERVELEIEPLPVRTDPTGPGQIWDREKDELYRLSGATSSVEETFARADHVFTATMELPRQTGLPIECRGLIAQWRGEQLHLWGPTKAIGFLRATLATMFDVQPSAVVCHGVNVGGMFGVRGEFYPEDFLIPWAASVIGRPVRWIEDRREHLLAINHARDQRHQISIAVDRDGRLRGIKDAVTIDSGAYPRPVGALLGEVVLRSVPGPYRWDDLDLSCTAVATNKTPIGTMRAPSVTEAAFARERLIDIAAHQLGIDPVELRRRNLISAEGSTWHLGADLGLLTYDGEDYRELFDSFLVSASYDELRREVAERRKGGEHVGIGVGCFVEGSGAGVFESVTLRLDDEGRFRVASLLNEIGQGLTDIAAGAVVEGLGLDPTEVEVSLGDSSAHDAGVGTFASRSTIFVTAAIDDATQKLLEIARERAAELVGDGVGFTPAADGLTCGDTTVYWKDVAPIEVTGTCRREQATTGFGAHLAVTAVDATTYEPRVERIEVGYDLGQVIDEPAATGQLVGATIFGLGNTLFEELRYDEQGEPHTTTLMEYRIPTAADVGEVRAHFVTPASREPGTVIRGAGEAGVVGVAPAVVNAAAAAVEAAGVDQLTRLPLTPAQLAALLRSKSDVDQALPPPHARSVDRRRPPRVGTSLALTAFSALAIAVWLLVRRRQSP